MSIQEAVDLEKSPQLRRLFSPQVFGRLPSTGRSRIRRTALGVVGLSSSLNYILHLHDFSGAYSSWFSIQSEDESNLLITALSYVVSALADPTLCQSAATALKRLCDANRKELAVHIGAFSELHSSLNAIPVGNTFIVRKSSKITVSRIRRKVKCFNQLPVLFKPCQ